MATDFFLKQGDTAPPIVAVLKDASLAVVPLTAATSVRFLMSDKLSGVPAVNHLGTIVDAVNGKVSYQWQPGDSDIVSTYNGEWEIAWSDGTYETFPNSKYMTIKIVKDLGGTVG